MAIESEFLRLSAVKLEKMCGRIETCVSKLTPEQVWARQSENENAIGNLILHLMGNVRQWIISGVGGAPDTRVRELEFSQREIIPPAQLAARLHETVQEAVAVLRAQKPERMMDALRIQNYDVTRLEAIYQVIEHFTGHTYQIIFATKLFTGQDLKMTQLPGPAAAGVKTP